MDYGYRYKSACGNRVVDRNIDVVIKTDSSTEQMATAGEVFLISWASENQQDAVLKLDCLTIVNASW